MPDSMFMRRIRSKLIGADVEGGESDVGDEGLSKDIPGGRAREDYSVNVVNRPQGAPPTRGVG